MTNRLSEDQIFEYLTCIESMLSRVKESLTQGREKRAFKEKVTAEKINERIGLVLRLLSEFPLTFHEIRDKTSFDSEVLKRLLSHLVDQSLVYYVKGRYQRADWDLKQL